VSQKTLHPGLSSMQPLYVSWAAFLFLIKTPKQAGSVPPVLGGGDPAVQVTLLTERNRSPTLGVGPIPTKLNKFRA
jgi:hypothetical protein